MKYTLLGMYTLLFFAKMSISLPDVALKFPAYQACDGAWAAQTLARLTTRQKIGQLFMVATAAAYDQKNEELSSSFFSSPYNLDPEYIDYLIKEYAIGGVIFLYKSTPEQQIDAINRCQQLSSTPLLIGQDCEWGLSMRLYTTIRFPKNMTLGALADKQLIYELGREIGRQCKAIGVHINFSPVVDVNNNCDNPVIHDRSFGSDPCAVAQAGLLMMQGLQDAGIIACAKHFPGHGDTATDSHVALPCVVHTQERLERIELIPFKHLIDHGICAVMNAHLAITKLESNTCKSSSLSHAVVTDLLQEKMGFKGLIITDGLGMQALTNHYEPGDSELQAFLAGNDILLCPLDVPKAVEYIEQALRDGKVSLEELDRRVLKILKAKEWAGCHRFTPINKERALKNLTSDHARQLKERAYQQAVTMVTPGKSNIQLPTDWNKTVIIQISGNQQCEFKKQLQKKAQCNYYNVVRDQDLAINELFDVVEKFETVIVSLFDLNKNAKNNFGISHETLNLYRELCKRKKHVIVVIFGSPYAVQHFSKTTSLIAYEDDPDAQKAAANVLLGNKIATGTLPVILP